VGYEGGRLRPWFDTRPNDRFCRRAAHAGGRRLTAVVKEKTPVDTKHLQDSIRQKPVIRILDTRGRTVYESGAETDVEYAPYVEHGTGLWGPKHAKYVIEPKNPDGWLHWVNDMGEDVFAKRVWHPGSPGAHMFAIGAGIVEAELPEIVGPHLERWRLEVERQNKSDRNLGSRA
jgi:hypothetical protein